MIHSVNHLNLASLLRPWQVAKLLMGSILLQRKGGSLVVGLDLCVQYYPGSLSFPVPLSPNYFFCQSDFLHSAAHVENMYIFPDAY